MAAARREGWQAAVDAAWRQMGRRYWRLIVGMQLAGRVLPWLAAATLLGFAVYGIAWVVRHVRAPQIHLDFGWVWPTLIFAGIALTVVGGIWAAVRWWSPDVAEPTVRRVGAVVVTTCAAALLWTWQRT